MADFSALLVVAVRSCPKMFAETKHIVATSTSIQEAVMPWVVNRTMKVHESWLDRTMAESGSKGRLHNALWDRNPARIRDLLRWGADTRATYSTEELTPLALAVQINGVPLESIRALVEADPGAVCVKCKSGRTPLNHVLELYRGIFSPERARLLVEAAPESIHIPGPTGRTPAQEVARFRHKMNLGDDFVALFC
jgi:hypothetical protein